MSRSRLLVITNCQGPVLVQRFLQHAVPEFNERFDLLAAIQVQQLTEQDANSVSAFIAKAEIVIAQPIWRSPVADVTYDRLATAMAGRQLLLFPALHYDAVFTPSQRSVWKGIEGYPLGQIEDVALAAAFVAGLDPEKAVRLWHEVPLLTKGELQERIELGIREFRNCEEEARVHVPMSDFYGDMWRNDVLHYIKSHPRAVVYEELCRRFVGPLGLRSPDFSSVHDRRGNDIIELPLKRWVHDLLGLRFSTDHDHGRVRNERRAFVEIVELLWAFYATQGRAKVERRHSPRPDFLACLAAMRRAA